MKLRYKVFLIFFALAIVPLSVLTAVAYDRYRITTYQQMDTVTQNMYSNAIAELEDTIDDIKQSAGMFTFYSDSSYSIVENLKQFSDPDSTPDNYEILKANSNIKFVCQNIMYSYDYINGLYVFTPSGAILRHVSQASQDLVNGYDYASADWYQETLDLNGALYISAVDDHEMFLNPHESVFFAECLRDVYSHEFLGVLLIDCKPELFDLSNINTMPDITLFTLTNTDNGGILYSNADTAVSSFPAENEVRFSQNLSLENLCFTAEFDYNALLKQYDMTGYLLITLFIVCTVGILLLSYVLSKNLIYPIEHLSRKMAAQSGAHLTLSGRYLNRTDEVGVLYNEYNSMIEALDNSIKKDYQNKLITLDAQMKSLEARINSHFLFNTLESINSIAEIENNERIATMALALGNMFRYSIKTKSELVTVADELKNVDDYVSIQQIRFNSRFRLSVEIPDTLYRQKVLKLILQPLVENALYHGLKYCTFGDTITLRALTQEGCLLLTVSDNGAGMSAEQQELLRMHLQEEASFTELGQRNKESIGLKNIHSRIELYYGKGYGLSVSSHPGEGTTITIRLPLVN